MGSKSYVAVIDLHRAGRVGIYEEQDKLPLVQSVSKLKIYAESGYRGNCEFVIWKEIQRRVATMQNFNQMLIYPELLYYQLYR